MDTIPDTRMWRVRNINFCSQELETLLPARTQKLAGTTLNAYAAVIQQVAECSSTGADFCFFSSWIPALASGAVRAGGFEGTVEDHVLAAAVNGDTTVLRTRVRWGIPLCGGSPPHWVLGYIDYNTSSIGIVDSMPGLNSRGWAEPVSNCVEFYDLDSPPLLCSTFAAQLTLSEGFWDFQARSGTCSRSSCALQANMTAKRTHGPAVCSS